MMRKIIVTVLMMVQIALSGCLQSTSPAFDQGQNEEKPSIDVESMSGVVDTSNMEARPGAKLVFEISVFSASGIRMCGGTELHMTVMSDLTLKQSGGGANGELIMNCSSFKLNLGGLMSGLTSDEMSTDLAKDNEIKDGVFYKEKMMGMNFAPARPLSIVPLLSDHAKMKGLKVSVDTIVEGFQLKNQKPYTGNGNVTLEVLETDSTHTSRLTKEIFNKIIKWRVRKTGFEGLDPMDGFLVPEITWWWNTAPLMIPRLEVRLGGRSMLKTVTDDEKAIDAVSDLLGDILLVFEVKQHS
jgi:hypothetical protein